MVHYADWILTWGFMRLQLRGRCVWGDESPGYNALKIRAQMRCRPLIWNADFGTVCEACCDIWEYNTRRIIWVTGQVEGNIPVDQFSAPLLSYFVDSWCKQLRLLGWFWYKNQVEYSHIVSSLHASWLVSQLYVFIAKLQLIISRVNCVYIHGNALCNFRGMFDMMYHKQNRLTRLVVKIAVDGLDIIVRVLGSISHCAIDCDVITVT